MTLSESGNIYVAGAQNFYANITSPGAWEENPNPDTSQNAFVGKFDTDGNIIGGTYYPGDKRSGLISALPHANGDDESFYITGITLSSTGMSTDDGL